MKVEEAITDLHWIQDRLKGSEIANCLRAPTIGCVGLLGVLAGVVQETWVPMASTFPMAFLVYWSVVATVAIGIVTSDVLLRHRWGATSKEVWQFQQIGWEFGPCIVVGGIVSYAVVLIAPDHAAILPALWAACFSLGVFAVRHRLPQVALIVAGYYVVCSVVCVGLSTSELALRPITMGAVFGGGHLLAAFLLCKTRMATHGS